MTNRKAPKINIILGKGGIVLFRRNIRSAIRGLWTGAITEQQALTTFRSAIETAIDKAWVEGAAECNITENELTLDELIARDNFIFQQNEFVPGFIADIVTNSKVNGGKLTPLLTRGEKWVNRYNDAKSQSQSLACADQKGEWILGPTEKHCPSCSGFNGRVYRLSTWRSNNALPQSQCLACNGFRCQCQIQPTDKSVTKGPFPRRLVQC